VRLYNTKI